MARLRDIRCPPVRDFWRSPLELRGRDSRHRSRQLDVVGGVYATPVTVLTPPWDRTDRSTPRRLVVVGETIRETNWSDGIGRRVTEPHRPTHDLLGPRAVVTGSNFQVLDEPGDDGQAERVGEGVEALLRPLEKLDHIERSGFEPDGRRVPHGHGEIDVVAEQQDDARTGHVLAVQADRAGTRLADSQPGLVQDARVD